jgi:predicted nuclease with TOPRIM domain
MSETVIVALVSLVGTLGGTFGGIMASSKLTNYRIEQLEKKQDKYNGVIERVYILEKGEAVLEEEIKVANHRIEDLEHFHK